MKKLTKNNFQIAEDLYKEKLLTNPNHFESIFNLGTLFLQTQRFDLAKSLLDRAIKIQPNHAGTHNNLGAAFEKLGESQISTTLNTESFCRRRRPEFCWILLLLFRRVFLEYELWRR